MKHDNPLIKQKVMDVVGKHYRIPIKTIKFIPVGEESFAYKVVSTDLKEYFVRYCERKESIEKSAIINKLLIKLSHYDFVVPPLTTNEESFVKVLKGVVTVFPFIKGKVITKGNHELNKTLVAKLLKVMVRIHQSTLLVGELPLPEEDFKNNFSMQLNKILKSVKNKPEIDHKVIRLLKENQKLIEELIEKHTSLGNKYQKKVIDFVLTHGDITGLNIIDTDEGLKLVDWEGAMLAPPERDLNFFSSNPHFSIKEYLKMTRRKTYDPELREYYGQQWSLSSILGNFEKLLSSKSKYVDKEECLEEIKEYLSYWD